MHSRRRISSLCRIKRFPEHGLFSSRSATCYGLWVKGAEKGSIQLSMWIISWMNAVYGSAQCNAILRCPFCLCTVSVLHAKAPEKNPPGLLHNPASGQVSFLTCPFAVSCFRKSTWGLSVGERRHVGSLFAHAVRAPMHFHSLLTIFVQKK